MMLHGHQEVTMFYFTFYARLAIFAALESFWDLSKNSFAQKKQQPLIDVVSLFSSSEPKRPVI